MDEDVSEDLEKNHEVANLVLANLAENQENLMTMKMERNEENRNHEKVNENPDQRNQNL
jgi:hypothetical protein